MWDSARPVFCAAAVLVLAVGYASRASNPPQPFSITISTVHDTFKSRDEISVQISLTNTSNKDIFLTGVCAPKADVDGFRIEVQDAQGRAAPETNALRSLRGEPVPRSEYPLANWSGPSCGIVPPKGFSNSGFILNRFYDLSKPGKYKIQVQRTDPRSKVTVKSNTITVTIVGVSADMTAQGAKADQSASAPLSLTISGAKATAKAGSTVQIDVVARNISGHDILLQMYYLHPYVEITGRVNIVNRNGENVSETEFGREALGHPATAAVNGKLVDIALKTDKSFMYQLNIDELYDLSRAGKYTVQMERFDEGSKTFVKSNKITVTVTP
ncbi:MAG: hypothetical protein ACYDDI_03130 [Candidatus Acidiferrales bacterium]